MNNKRNDIHAVINIFVFRRDKTPKHEMRSFPGGNFELCAFHRQKRFVGYNSTCFDIFDVECTKLLNVIEYEREQ
jgi:hypothetical protein